MIMTVNPDKVKSETIKLTYDVETKSRQVLIQKEQIKVYITFFWNSHGKLIPWTCDGKKSKTMSNVNVRIEDVKETIKWDSEHSFDTNYWDLLVNEKHIPGDCCSYTYNPELRKLTVKQIVGCG